jgi:uncharacterized protein (TIGR03437 family)
MLEMTALIKAGGRLVAALSLAAFPAGALAASSNLSFTAHSLNLSPGNPSLLLALDGQGDGYEVATVDDSSGRAWIRVTKTDLQGAVVASSQFGGTGTDTPTAIKVDAQAEVVIAGTTNSKDFPVTVALVPAIQKSAAFVVKLDSGLVNITASTLIGGSKYAPSYQGSGTVASGLDVDSEGDIYLGGGTAALDFPVTAGAYQTTPPGYDEFGAAAFGFLAEISPSLDKIIFATYYGPNTVPCTGSDCIDAWAQSILGEIAVDGSGAVIASSGLVKFAPGGGSVLWSTVIPPDGYDGYEDPLAFAVDDNGNVVVVGVALWGEAASAGAVQSCDSSTQTGGFVAKLSGSNGSIQFLTYFGCRVGAVSPGEDPSVNSVAVDPSGTIWITGTADPSSLPLTPSSPSGSSYLAALAPDGSSVEALYTAFAAFDPTAGVPVGMFGQALALTPTGTPVVLGSSGFLMLSNTAGGPSLLGVANSAGSAASGLVALAELASFYGTGLGPATPLDAQVVNGVVESSLGGYQLLFGGVAAPLLYMSANQINAVVPNEVSGQDSVSVTLVTPSGTFPLADLYMRPSEPEIFHDPVSGYAVAINQDGTLNSASNPAHAGELVSIWGTGSGAPNGGVFPVDGTIVPSSGSTLSYPALPVSVLAGYLDSLEVVYAGDSPGEVFGLLQVNFQVPQPLPSESAAAGSLVVSLQVGAAVSGTEWIYVAP